MLITFPNHYLDYILPDVSRRLPRRVHGTPIQCSEGLKQGFFALIPDNENEISIADINPSRNEFVPNSQSFGSVYNHERAADQTLTEKPTEMFPVNYLDTS